MARTPDGTMNGWPPTVPGAAIGGKTKASAALVLSLWTMQAPEAPRLARRRQGDGHGEIHGDRGIGGVAAGQQDIAADLGGAAFVGGDGGEGRRAVGNDAGQAALPGDRPAGLAAWAARSVSRSVSLLPQAASKNSPPAPGAAPGVRN